MLTDPDITQKISTRLAHYFQDNATDDISPTTIWAAHKCVIRGDFISLAAFQNKQRRAHINALSSKIHTLERAHKSSLATKSLEELLQAREALREEIHKSLRRKYILNQKLYYEFGNKSGKLLAKALQHKKATHTIHEIKDSSWKSFVSPDDIATQFVNYFSKLYNLPHTEMTEPTRNRQEAIYSFLSQYGGPPISIDDSKTLDSPIEIEETTAALKQLKSGKSPGPDGLTIGYYKTFQDILAPQFTKAFNSLPSSPQSNKATRPTRGTYYPNTKTRQR